MLSEKVRTITEKIPKIATTVVLIKENYKFSMRSEQRLSIRRRVLLLISLLSHKSLKIPKRNLMYSQWDSKCP